MLPQKTLLLRFILRVWHVAWHLLDDQLKENEGEKAEIKEEGRE
jgi:hypothetical protein